MTLQNLTTSLTASTAAASRSLVAFLLGARSFVASRPAGFLALVATVVFYYPSLRSRSADAGSLYTGDVLGLLWPAMIKTQSLLSSFHFTAIDFSTYNGSSDYFLAPNYPAVHPLLVAFSLLFGWLAPSMRAFGHFLMLALALHSFCACYFSQKLLMRFFGLEFGAAAVAGLTFAFSTHVVAAMGEPQFLLCTTMMPCAAYGALVFARVPGLRTLLAASVPVLFAFLGGYVPLGVASMGVALIIVAVKSWVADEGLPAEERMREVLLALAPFLVASIVVLPYFLAVYDHLHSTAAAQEASLFFSAHQLAQEPQSLLRHISARLQVPGSVYEFTFSAGVIAVAVGVLFIFSRTAVKAMTPRDWSLFTVCLALYVVFVLATFGRFTPISDLVYYLVPQVGGMHIYQRFLLLGQFFLAVVIAIMLRAVLDARPETAIKIMTAVMAVLVVASAQVVAQNPTLTAQLGLNNYVVLELFTALLFMLALAIPGRQFAYTTAVVLMLLPAVGMMYDYSRQGSTFADQIRLHPVALDREQRRKVVDYLRRFSDKAVVKYVDLTPLWSKEGIEAFPKSFPYLVLRDLRLSSYSGFEFRMSPRAEYMATMPMALKDGLWVQTPDWELVARQGADFVVAPEKDLKEGWLADLAAKVLPADLFHLPGGVVLVPLRPGAKAPKPTASTVDNGVFRVFATATSPPPQLPNVALGKPATQSSTLGTREARFAVDGNTNGEFDQNSVSHTNQDVNAWLDIDLGSVQAIDSVRIWNITTCCQFRVRDPWLFISEDPFMPTDTAATLKSRPRTWGKMNPTPNPTVLVKTGDARGRYIRVQLGGGQPPGEAFLHLAEVEVFAQDVAQAEARAKTERVRVAPRLSGMETDFASAIDLKWESAEPTTVQYLFSPNPRLKYYLNGQPAKVLQRDGLVTVEAPAGRNTLEIRYGHWVLRLYWLLFFVWAAACAWAVASLVVPRLRLRLAQWRQR